MKSFLLLSFFVYTLSAQALFRCRFGVQTRREWRNLGTAQKTYIDALRNLMRRPNANTPSFYDTLVKEHMDYGNSVHGFSPFFPWHRYMLAKLEQELQKSGNIALPYWNWGFDSQTPEKAPFWGTDALHFGTNGNSRTGCVTDGAFAGYTTFYPTKRCLRRKWTTRTTIGAFPSEDNLQNLVRSNTNYNSYRSAIESPHGLVHVEIGGRDGSADMGDPRTSPNDPVFYLHHAYVDRLWWKWQVAYPRLANTYGGQSFNIQSGTTFRATTADRLTPYNARVSDVFNTENLCYRYIEENLAVTRPKLPPPTVQPRRAQPGQGRAFDNGGAARPRPPRNIDEAPPGAMPPLADGVTTQPAPKAQTPDSTDRSDLTKLRIPNPLPALWIKANNLDEDKVRANEQKVADNIKESNAKGVVADGALWTRPGVLAKLVEDGIEKFHADVDNLRVEVKAPAEAAPLQAIANLKEIVKQTLKEEGKDDKVQLTHKQ